VVRVGVVEDGSTEGCAEAGRAKSCMRVLAPIRVLGKARGRGAFKKLGAVFSEYGVWHTGTCRRVDTCRKTLEKVNLVQAMIKLVILLCVEELCACGCWNLWKTTRREEHFLECAPSWCHG